MDNQKLTDYLDSLLGYGIPSVDCVVYRDHKEIFRYMTGTVDAKRKVPVSKDQRYLMFSMTKVQTMVALMQLVEQGKISLESDVKDFLPSFSHLKVLKDGKEEECQTTLKIKHLVSMQSGLDYDLERPGIKRVLKERGDKATTREIVDSFTDTPLLFEPGTHYLYSLSHDVVAAIIEVVSGMSFSEYLKKNLWEPLHMDNTFFAGPMNDDVEGLAQQYETAPDGQVVLKEQSCNYQLSKAYESGGAGLISCTEDYIKLADTVACGGVSKDGIRIISEKSINTIKTNLLCDASMKEIAENMGRVGYGYGVGMQVFLNPEKVNSPAPSGIFGWDGACGSAIMMETRTKTSVVFTMHVRGFGIAYSTIHPKIRDIVFGGIL